VITPGWDIFSTAVGRLCHFAPEQLEGKCYSGEKVDIWAMGVALFRMIVGRPPFTGKSIQVLVKDIKDVNYSLPDFVSPGSSLFISLDLSPSLFDHQRQKTDSGDQRQRI